jgi:pentatricopeptide repeat protein
MKLKLIKSKKEYEACLKWVDDMFEKKIKPNTSEGVLLLIKAYEDEHLII